MAELSCICNQEVVISGAQRQLLEYSSPLSSFSQQNMNPILQNERISGKVTNCLWQARKDKVSQSFQSSIFLLFRVGSQGELGSMAEWDGLVLELAGKAEAGSGKYNFTSQFYSSVDGKALLTWGWPCVRCPVLERSPLARRASPGVPRTLQSVGRIVPSAEQDVGALLAMGK